jgi:hypothetical protein
MLKASRNPRVGLLGDFTYQVTSADSGGDEIATINETKMTIDLGERSFSVNRKGVLGPEFELKSGEKIIASASQKPFFNQYKLVHDGKEWRFKALGLLALKFGLFRGDTQIGTIATRWVNRLKDIRVDLPDELPSEVQVFLLLLLVRHWSDTNN